MKQNSHLFQGQPLVMRMSALSASLGGLNEGKKVFPIQNPLNLFSNSEHVSYESAIVEL